MSGHENRWWRAVVGAAMLGVLAPVSWSAPGPQVQGLGAGNTSCGSLEWYVRIGVQTPDGSMVDRNSVLGWLWDASDGQDRYDLEELPPFTTPYLTLVFPQDGFEPAGDYASDYHDTCLDGVGLRSYDQWVFQVKTDDGSRSLELWWEPVTWVDRPEVVQAPDSAIVQALRRMMGRYLYLQDVDTGRWIRMEGGPGGGGQRYAFEMGGKQVKTFRVVFFGWLYAQDWNRFGGARQGVRAASVGEADAERRVSGAAQQVEALLSELPAVEVEERPVELSEGPGAPPGG